MKTEDLLLTVAHLSNETRLLSAMLEQSTSQARQAMAERDAAQAKVSGLEAELQNWRVQPAPQVPQAPQPQGDELSQA